MSEANSQITIIVPVFNKRKYLDRALISILHQEFCDYECILVDDGSFDGSESICDHYAQIDSRFRVFHIKKQGVSHARNLALSNARGEYVVFIDGDDEVNSTYLSNLMQIKREHNPDLVISWICSLDEQGKIHQKPFPIEPGAYDFNEMAGSFADLQFRSGIFGWCVSKLIPFELIKDIRFDEDLKLAEDLDFYIKVYSKISTIYMDNAANYYYRQNTDNSSVRKDDEIDYVSQLRLLIRMKDLLVKKNVWESDNKRIIEAKVLDYAYFSIFHCDFSRFNSCFGGVYALLMDANLEKHNAPGFKGMIISSLMKYDVKRAKMLVGLYRFCRRMAKRR